MVPIDKPRLTAMCILDMNPDFLGLQFSFGLQQGNMAPFHSDLGADEASLPLLHLGGPLTGLSGRHCPTTAGRGRAKGRARRCWTAPGR